MFGSGAAILQVPAALNGDPKDRSIVGNLPPQQVADVEVPPSRFDREWLDLSSSVIEEKETKILARALVNNRLKNLKTLFLEGNAGDLGMRAMLDALRAGHLKGLEKFILWGVSSYNQITAAEEGTETIADAVAGYGLPNLDTMDLTRSLPKKVPARSWSTATMDLFRNCSCGTGRLRESGQICLGCACCTGGEEKNQALECLRCQFGRLTVYTGDDGIRKIGIALRKSPIPSLRFLILQENYISDKGASELAKILRRGLLPHLVELDLQNNPVGTLGAVDIVNAFLRNPLLTTKVKLDWPNSFLKEKAVAFRESNIRLESRLEDLNIPHTDLVINKDYKSPNYYLSSAKTGRRLRLLCQADASNRAKFEDHKVELQRGEPEGIELRIRSFSVFVNSSQNFIRELRENPQPFVDTTGAITNSGEELPTGGIKNSGEELPDDQTTSTHGLDREQGSDHEQDNVDLKRTTGVNSLVISGPFGFIAAAKAQGSPIGRQPRHARFQRLKRFFQNSEKTEKIMTIIKEELLMLAERKPDEFYNLFGLRQVLLRNPEKHNRYSRLWICNSCYAVYQGSKSVESITTDVELNLVPRDQNVTGEA